MIFFHAPRSFTGEDVIEFQVTGSRAVLAALLKTLSCFPAVRPAEAGEFARRSFANGKRDLAEIEGMALVVEADTIVQLRHAQRSASGQLSRECENIRANLVRCMALVETLLDFSDVEDPEHSGLVEVFAMVKDLRERTKSLLVDSHASERLREGLVIVIAGPPNAGKSSLINHLARREVSIVSAIPGTTRDLIEISMDVAGFPIVLVDSAGIRESNDPIEAEGIARARKRSDSADLTLWLSSCLDGEDGFDGAQTSEVLCIKTKCDLAPDRFFSSKQIGISTVTGEGISALVERIASFAHSILGGPANSLITTQRQSSAILEADAALARFLCDQSLPLEVLAEELRTAGRCMSCVAGRIDVENVLSDVFSRLCVGK